MKKLIGYLSLTLILLLSIGCASGFKDIKVSTDSDPKVNLSNYKTYTWLGSAQIIQDDYGQWKPPQFDADAEMRFLINKELHDRGMTENSENPNMFVGFAAGVDMDNLEIKANPDTALIDIKNIPKAALIVLFVDAQSGYPIWVAEADGNAETKPDTETAKKRLSYAVKEMFKQLPK